jgi:hypothetical protein
MAATNRPRGRRATLAPSVQSPSITLDTKSNKNKNRHGRHTMIRTTMTMLALGFLAVSDVSAMAATKATHHPMKIAAKTAVVAQAEGAAPSGDAAKPAKEPKKGHRAKGGGKAKAKAAGGEMPSTPAPEAAPKQ